MSERIGHIYLIRNLLNSKGYIGQTVRTIANRMRRHRYEAKKGSVQAIHAAIRKYGIENFAVIELVRCPIGLLNRFEPEFIRMFNTFAPTGHGYNLNFGGDGNEGYKPSVESIKKMSDSHKGKSNGPHSQETKAKIARAATGRVHSEDTKLKMRLAKKRARNGN